MTKERHTIISIVLVTPIMVGRKDDLEFQHSPHILHHSSVIGKRVFSMRGRHGGPFKIFIVMGTRPRVG